MNDNPDKVRIDRWLWAARFYKTRQLAVKALKTGQISANKQSVKPATIIKIGDHLLIKRGVYQMEVEVLAVLEKRVSAKIAQTLYRETEDSMLARQALKQQLENQPKIDIDRRKPDKRGIRSHRAVKRGE